MNVIDQASHSSLKITPSNKTLLFHAPHPPKGNESKVLIYHSQALTNWVAIVKEASHILPLKHNAQAAPLPPHGMLAAPFELTQADNPARTTETCPSYMQTWLALTPITCTWQRCLYIARHRLRRVVLHKTLKAAKWPKSGTARGIMAKSHCQWRPHW